MPSDRARGKVTGQQLLNFRVKLYQNQTKIVGEAENMSKSPHKYQEKMQSGMTYEQYSRDRCHEMVRLAEELERVLGRKKALEIMGKARDRYIVEMTKKGHGLISSFEDFKPSEKAENASPYFSLLSDIEGSHIKSILYP